MAAKFGLIFSLLFFSFISRSSFAADVLKVLPPTEGAYHGAFADSGLSEDEVSAKKIKAFEETVGKDIAWAYFSSHWTNEIIKFPTANVEACKQAGTIPYIRMSPWAQLTQNKANKITMQKIIDGRYDQQLAAWARAARDSGTAIMIEFGPEVDGKWFPWNGTWNGGGRTDKYGDPKWPDGPERFRDAYIHIIDLFREEGALNITWVLHVDVGWDPQVNWNRVKYYYPGDEYIDYVGISVFGRQLPKSEWELFPELLEGFLEQVTSVTDKPMIISEYGVIEDPKNSDRKADWIHEALQSLPEKFPQIKGITYWNSPGWTGYKNADFRITSSSASLKAYRSEVAKPYWLGKATVGAP